MIRLSKDAPWNKVSLLDGDELDKITFKDKDISTYRHVAKFIEYKNEIITKEQPELTSPIVEDNFLEVDLNSMSKAELVEYANKIGKDVKGLKKNEILEMLNA